MPIGCIQNIIGWGETRQRREEVQVEDCTMCPKYEHCNRPKDEKYSERHCMNYGEGCSYNVNKTTEERRMER